MIDEFEVRAGWVRELVPPSVNGWQQVPAPFHGQYAFQNRVEGFQVLMSGDRIDGDQWLHVSVVKRIGYPSYTELVKIKQFFLGDRLAVQVFAPKAEHVNIHPRALHLWCCINRRVTPDFTGGTGSI